MLGAAPLGCFAEQDEIARLARILCSPAVACMTGAICVIDSGSSLTSSRLLPLGAT